jgi:hypothetical protein
MRGVTKNFFVYIHVKYTNPAFNSLIKKSHKKEAKIMIIVMKVPLQWEWPSKLDRRIHKSTKLCLRFGLVIFAVLNTFAEKGVLNSRHRDSLNFSLRVSQRDDEEEYTFSSTSI